MYTLNSIYTPDLKWEVFLEIAALRQVLRCSPQKVFKNTGKMYDSLYYFKIYSFIIYSFLLWIKKINKFIYFSAD